MPIAICGVSEIPTFAAIPLDHIISIREAHQPGPDIRAFKHPFTLHSFVFADTGDATNPLAPTKTMMERLLDIYNDTAPADNMLFHCYAGVSRSSAAAFIWLVNHGISYAAAYATVVRVRGPFVCPNQLMIKHADALMGHNGEMAAFISAETGRRAEERAAWFEQHQ